MEQQGIIDFDFNNEESSVEFVLRAINVTPLNFNYINFLSVNNDDHDTEDSIVEQIKIEIKQIRNNAITLIAFTPNQASNVYSFKYTLNYGD